MAGRDVGRVAALWRYPVKGMAAQGLDEADVSWHGLAGDRRWAFVRGDVPRSGFPWLTVRRRRDLLRYEPSFTDPARPDRSPTTVRTPGGEQLDVADPRLAAGLGDGVRVIKQDRGVFDSAPLSLISTGSVERLEGGAGRRLDVRRFRPNLVVEAGEPEEEWIGAVLRIGAARIRVDRRNERCVVVNVDPDTAADDPAVLRTVTAERDACVGVYATTVEPGRVAVGDRVIAEG